MPTIFAEFPFGPDPESKFLRFNPLKQLWLLMDFPANCFDYEEGQLIIKLTRKNECLSFSKPSI